MNKSIIYGFLSFFIFTSIVIIFCFTFKFDKYTKSYILNHNNKYYLYLTNDSYKKLNDYNKIIIIDNNIKKEYKTYSYLYDNLGYFLIINNFYMNQTFKDVLVKLKSVNLFGF